MTSHSANYFSIVWGPGKLTFCELSSEQLLHDFDEAHMAFGQVSARARERERERDKQGSVKRVVIFAFPSTNDEKRERSRCLGRCGQITVKVWWVSEMREILIEIGV